jgi:hypothetical protein
MSIVDAVGTGCGNGQVIGIKNQHVRSTNHPSQLTFATTHIGLSGQYEGKIIVGGIKTSSMGEPIAPRWLQKHFIGRHRNLLGHQFESHA